MRRKENRTDENFPFSEFIMTLEIFSWSNLNLEIFSWSNLNLEIFSWSNLNLEQCTVQQNLSEPGDIQQV